MSEDSYFDFRCVKLCDLDIPGENNNGEFFANSGDPDQTPRSALSDQGLHCLPITHLGVARLQIVKALSKFVANDILKLILLFCRENKVWHFM